MDEPVTLSGRLSDISLPTFMMSLYHQRESGVLFLTEPTVGRRLYLDEGSIAYAVSDNPDDGLGDWLFRKGLITMQQYIEGRDSLQVFGSWSQTILKLRLLSPENLLDVMTQHLYDLLSSIFGMKSGNYSVELGPYSALDMANLSLDMPVVVYRGMKRMETWNRMFSVVGEPSERLAMAPEFPAHGAQLEIEGDEAHVLDLCRARMLVSSILDASYLSPFETYRLLWIFLTLGLIVHVDEEASENGRSGERSLADLIDKYNNLFAIIHEKLSVLPGAESIVQESLRELPRVFPELGELQDELVFQGKFNSDAVLNKPLGVSGSEWPAHLQSMLDEVLDSLVLASQIHLPEETHGEILRTIHQRVK